MYKLLTTLSGYQLKDSLTGHVMSVNNELVDLLAEKGAIENVVWKAEEKSFELLGTSETELLSMRIVDTVKYFHEVCRTIDAPVICGVLGSTLDDPYFHRFFVCGHDDGMSCSYGAIDYIVEDEEYNSCIINWLDRYKVYFGKTFDTIKGSKKNGECYYKSYLKPNGFAYENWVKIGDEEFRGYNGYECKPLKRAGYLITSKTLGKKPFDMLDEDYNKTDFLFSVPKNKLVLYCTTEGEVLYVLYKPDTVE